MMVGQPGIFLNAVHKEFCIGCISRYIARLAYTFMQPIRILALFFGIFAAFFAWVNLSNYYYEKTFRREHAQQFEQTYNEILLPAVKFIRTSVEQKHRLPTFEEMDGAGFFHMGSTGSGDGGISEYMTEFPKEGFSGAVTGKDFEIATEKVPGWTVVYHSWDDKWEVFQHP